MESEQTFRHAQGQLDPELREEMGSVRIGGEEYVRSRYGSSTSLDDPGRRSCSGPGN